MLYNVGDVVLVRSDLQPGGHYDNSPESIADGGGKHMTFVRDMVPCMGNPVQIIAIANIPFDGYFYRIAEDGNHFWWSDDMFEGLYEDLTFDASQYDLSDLLTQ